MLQLVCYPIASYGLSRTSRMSRLTPHQKSVIAEVDRLLRNITGVRVQVPFHMSTSMTNVSQIQEKWGKTWHSRFALLFSLETPDTNVREPWEQSTTLSACKRMKLILQIQPQKCRVTHSWMSMSTREVATKTKIRDLTSTDLIRYA